MSNVNLRETRYDKNEYRREGKRHMYLTIHRIYPTNGEEQPHRDCLLGAAHQRRRMSEEVTEQESLTWRHSKSDPKRPSGRRKTS